MFDLEDPGNPVKIGELPIAQFGPSANSVDAHNGVVAVAIEAAPKTSPGTVAFFRATTLELISSVTVGALPDMLAFTPNGDEVVVANEGEPATDYSIDPEGTVSIIDVKNINNPVARTAGFGAFNGQANTLRAAGIRIYGVNASVAQDLEPEYIAVSNDSRTAYVTLQENNALGVIDLTSATVTELLPLGYKDHSLAANKLDVSDRDTTIRITTWPVKGMYQPDAIAAYTVGSQTFLVLANEGDAREWAALTEQVRVSSLTLEPTIFTDALCGGPCSANAVLAA
jgi:DNA-binding beta-propeller fold protein YncE